MQRAFLKPPVASRFKGLWKSGKVGPVEKLTPACRLIKRMKYYCRPITRADLLHDAKIIWGKA